MWIFTKYGFYSVVEHPRHCKLVVVRARRKEHLDNLVQFAEAAHLPRGNERIEESPKRDYRWRLVMAKDSWAKLAQELASEISYKNFKEEVRRTGFGGWGFLTLLHDIWVKCWDYQNDLEEEPNDEEEAIEEAQEPTS